MGSLFPRSVAKKIGGGKGARASIVKPIAALSAAEHAMYRPLVDAMRANGIEPRFAIMTMTSRSARLARQSRAREWKRLEAEHRRASAS